MEALSGVLITLAKVFEPLAAPKRDDLSHAVLLFELGKHLHAIKAALMSEFSLNWDVTGSPLGLGEPHAVGRVLI